MKSYKSYITTLASALLFMSAVFATSGLDSRQAALDAKFNANEAKSIEELISVKQSIHETLSIGDPFVGEAPATRECEFDWTTYGSPTCDTAWDEFGISCAQLESNYSWDCSGCTCPGDVAKAFGAGADFTMLGGMLAGHDEGKGKLIKVNGSKYIEFYGSSSVVANKKHYGGLSDYRSSEGRAVRVKYRGKIKDTISNILGGIRSSCTYVGAPSLKQLSKCTTFVRVTNQFNRTFVD